MRRVLIVIATALALGAGVAACGGKAERGSGGSDETLPSPGPTSGRSSHPAPAGGPSDTSGMAGQSPAPGGSGASAAMQDVLGSMGSAVDEADECGLWTARERRRRAFADTASSSHGLQIEKGLEFVEAEHIHGRDYETIVDVVQADSEAVTFRAAVTLPVWVDTTGPRAYEVLRLTTDTLRRHVFRQDLATARCMGANYVAYPGELNTVPGATWEVLSRALFSELRGGGAVAVGLANEPEPGPRPTRGVTYVGTMTRVDSGPSSYSLILDDSLVEMPTLVARSDVEYHGAHLRQRVEFLDDAGVPLVLRSCCLRGGAQIVRISRPVDPARMEKTLADKRTLVLYRVHFPFNSDSILPGSGPVLEAIAGIMRKHPDWRLSVTGHTDSIGTEQGNLELSRRRARAVKAALVSILGGPAAARLATSGDGESSPLADNGTLEGRAANRRVEVRRE
jgi:outer membrane protein OmpA-like peptidoglycan-associated protein